MIKKLLLLSFIFLSTSSVVFGQIVFQETIIDTTNTFSIGLNSPSGTYLREALQLADIDGDGDIDMVTKSNPLLWIENTDGQGDLTVQHIIDEGVGGVNSIKTADLDGDGDMDIVMAENDFAVDVIAWYENIDGSGTFSAKQTISTQVNNPYAVYVEDIDGDNDLDVLSSSINDGKIAWYENTNGQGSFGSQQVITIASFSSTTQYIEVVAGDIDGDDDNDVLFAANGSPDEIVYWVENTNGMGDFGTPQEAFQVFSGMFTLTLADLDNDDDLDVYGQNSFDGLLSLSNDGSGNFSFSNQFSSNYDFFVGFAQLFDVDGDNDLDMFGIARNDGNETNAAAMVWFENTDGQGAYSSEQFIRDVNYTSFSSRLAAADIDGDNLTDIVVANLDGYELSWNKNQVGSVFFEDSQKIIIDLRELRGIISADIDGDDDEDLIYVSSNSKLSWYENIDAQGTFGPQQIIDASSFDFYSVVAEDIDGDDDLDLIAVARNQDKLVWFENDGSAQFSIGEIISDITINPEFVSVFDVDDDDDYDVVCLDDLGDRIVWYENTNGQGNFGTEQLIIDTIDDIKPFEYGDIDGDDDIDIIINEPFSWLSNDGNGDFGTPQVIPSSNEDAIKLLDIDGDGDLDVFTSDPIGWYENEDGQNDGDSDIVMSLFTGVNMDRIIYFKNYNGVFGNPITLGDINQSLTDIHVADLNNDGNDDIVYTTAQSLSNSSSGKIAWFRNFGVLDNLISGTVTYDSDSNGCDGSDPPISNIWIGSGSTSASFSTFTEEDGTFAIDVGQGDYSTLITPSLPDYFSVSPPIYNSSFVGDNEIDDTANFCVSSTSVVSDLNISIYPLGEPRPGFNIAYELVFNNIGTTALSGTVEFVYDNIKMQYETASVSPDAQTVNMLSFNFSDILPFESRSILIEFNVFAPPVTNIDDIITTTATINPISGDNTEDDNTYILQQTVVGSYDPNDISVLEGEQILLEQTDEYLHYIIRFQNTGTAEAINVRVTNIIDPKLEWFTFQLESLSHDGRVVIEDGIQATFSFDNIMLPSVSQDEAASNGYITYKIKPKPGAVLGDVFYNDASIFFDFNPAIVTNTVSTEVVDALSVPDVEVQDVELFPNPTSDILNVKLNSAIDVLTIVDLNGRVVNTYRNPNTNRFSVEDLSDGIYFVKIESNEKTIVKKLIKN